MQLLMIGKQVKKLLPKMIKKERKKEIKDGNNRKKRQNLYT